MLTVPPGTVAVVSENKLGRPKAANAHETRQRILDAARSLFARRGYEGASNRAIAEEANLTTGAIYHYFDRKLDIYLAVFFDTYELVDSRIGTAIDACDTMIDALRAFLEIAHEMNNEDPSLALFLHSLTVDTQRDPALAVEIRAARSRSRGSLYRRIADLGVKTGELDLSDRDRFLMLMMTIATGLVDEASGDPRKHQLAVEGIVALLEGKLLRPPTI